MGKNPNSISPKTKCKWPISTQKYTQHHLVIREVQVKTPNERAGGMAQVEHLP
jgi:hypothetical protein